MKTDLLKRPTELTPLLCSVELNAAGDKAYYCYDWQGERVRKVVKRSGGVVEERRYMGGYEVYRKTLAGATILQRTTHNISDGSTTFCRMERRDNIAPVLSYQYANHLGSASLELDAGGLLISYEEYRPFGTTSYRSGRTATEVSLKRYHYCGKERDEESGLYYYGARYYADWLARFVSVDPMAGERQWLNPYNYCQNNPVNRVDPDGALDDENEENLIPEKTYIPYSSVAGSILFKNGEVSKMNQAYEELNDFCVRNNISVQKNLDNIKGKIKREFRDKFNDYRNAKDNALEIQKALGRIVKASELGLVNGKNEFNFEQNDRFHPLADISLWNECRNFGGFLCIRMEISETTTSNGMVPKGSTSPIKNGDGVIIGFDIKISASSMEIDKTLANEIGDVYYNTVKEGMRTIENKKIESYAKRMHLNLAEAHDKLYKDNRLDSKKMSSYIECLFIKQFKQM